MFYSVIGQTDNNEKTSVKILNSGLTELKLQINTPIIETELVKTSVGFFNKIVSEGFVYRSENGAPALPVISRLIQVPENAQISIDIVDSHYTDYKLSDFSKNKYPLFPYQPSVSKGYEGEIPFYYDKSVYKTNDFLTVSRANAQIHGHIRNMRIASIDIYPLDYNPVSKTIRIYDEIILNISFPGADLNKTGQLFSKYNDVCFGGAASNLINHNAFCNTKDTISRYPIKMAIVSDPMFHDALQPFIAWKIKKGFLIEEAYTSDPAVGNTSTSIKSYLQNLYDNATASDPAPTFVLLVGDVAQVPTFNGTASSHATDLYYAEYTGDMLADAYFGRFSATNVSELQPQIDKTLEYEQYLFPTDTWLDTVVMIAGVDASWAPTHANGQVNYGASTYFNSTNGIYSYTHLYPASGNESSQIRAEIGRGVSFANYTAHGYSNGWGNPSFDKSDISAMNNAHKYPLMVGNACSTNTFDQTECFGEALLRANMKGAIGYIGGSNSTYWNEDFYWGVGVRSTINANPVYDANHLGSYDRTFHTHGEPFSEWFASQGQMVLAGNLAVLEGSPSMFNYYSEIYHLMGDPSLMIYFGKPSELTVNHPALVPLGQNTIAITTEPYAYVGVSQNGVWHGAGMADASGNLVINIIPFTNPGTASIVGTKQFRKPYISTFIVETPAGPYVLMENKTINDVTGNNNQQADIIETIGLNVTLKNYGLQNDSTVYAVLSSSDQYVEILNGVSVWGLIHSNSSKTINNAFTIKIDTLVPDQHLVPFVISIRDSSANLWTMNFNLKINAPNLKIVSLIINDAIGGNGNNKLDAGETVEMRIKVINDGHSDIWDATALLTTTSPELNIVSASWQHDSLYVGVPETGKYTVAVANNVPIGTVASVTLNVNAIGGYAISKTFTKNIGEIIEDWESNSFTEYPWQLTGQYPWIITSGSYYEGNYSARSAIIGNSQQSDLSITIDVLSDDSLSFYKKVSSEKNWDFLKFFIDGVEAGSWSGEVDWSVERFWITAGQRTLMWSYIKDYSFANGLDAAFLDNIVFPPISIISSDIELPLSKNDITIFPNPAIGDYVTVSALLDKNCEVQITVFSSDGRMVYCEKYKDAYGQIYLPVNLSGWESGIYTVNLVSQNLNYSKSFAVIK